MYSSLAWIDRCRVNFGFFLNCYARWIQTLIPAILPPRSILGLNYKSWTSSYSMSYSTVSYFTSESWIDAELSEWEEVLLIESGIKDIGGGRILVLFCGGGRLPMAFANRGFQVTGVDFNERFIELARKKASERDLPIIYLRKNVLDLQVKEFNYKYDYCFIPYLMYSTIPTKRLRENLLHILYSILKADGKVMFDVQILPKVSSLYRLVYKVNKTIAIFCGGNREYQLGDVIKNFGFYHFFENTREIQHEITNSGFKIYKLIYHPRLPFILGIILEK